MKSWIIRFQVLLVLWGVSGLAYSAQEAIVVADRAIIYADRLMSAPLGFISHGKKIKVGSIPRNNAQVYPIVVSGRVAYIKVSDVSTEKLSVGSSRLVAERFSNRSDMQPKTFYSLSYLNYSTQITLDKEPGLLKNNDSLAWQGVSLRGGVRKTSGWDFQMVMNYLTAEKASEKFTAFELGASAGYRIFETRRFTLRWVLDVLAIPFSNYAQGSLFRVNGYGFTAGTGVAINYLLGKYWGLTMLGGLYHSRIYGLDLPQNYPDFSPAFTGARLSLGLSYRF